MHLRSYSGTVVRNHNLYRAVAIASGNFDPTIRLPGLKCLNRVKTQIKKDLLNSGAVCERHIWRCLKVGDDLDIFLRSFAGHKFKAHPQHWM